MDIAEFCDFCRNFKAKTKTEFKKKMIVAPQYYLSRVKEYSQLLLGQAPNSQPPPIILTLHHLRTWTYYWKTIAISTLVPTILLVI